MKLFTNLINGGGVEASRKIVLALEAYWKELIAMKRNSDVMPHLDFTVTIYKFVDTVLYKFWLAFIGIFKYY